VVVAECYRSRDPIGWGQDMGVGTSPFSTRGLSLHKSINLCNRLKHQTTDPMAPSRLPTTYDPEGCEVGQSGIEERISGKERGVYDPPGKKSPKIWNTIGPNCDLGCLREPRSPTALVTKSTKFRSSSCFAPIFQTT